MSETNIFGNDFQKYACAYLEKNINIFIYGNMNRNNLIAKLS